MLLRPRSPVERYGSEPSAAGKLALEMPQPICKRIGMNNRVVADHTDIAALGAFETEIHEVAPAALAPRLPFRHLAIVLDDRDDVPLPGEPLDGAVVRAAVNHDDLVGNIDLARTHTRDGRLQERQPVVGAQHDRNLRGNNRLRHAQHRRTASNRSRNASTSLTKAFGVLVLAIFRPASMSWRRNPSSVASFTTASAIWSGEVGST